jgi:hypothetical protein
MMGAQAIGSATSAYGSVRTGQEKYLDAQFEREQLQIAAQQNKIAAAQAEAGRRQDLVSSLETIQAMRAGRNTGTYSPTGRAILANVVDDAESDIITERVNYMQRADLNRRASFLAERKGKASLLAGNLGAVESVATGIIKMGTIAQASAGPKRAR